MNKGLMRLLENIQRLIDEGYEDESIDYFLVNSLSVNELNESIEDEFTYGG